MPAHPRHAGPHDAVAGFGHARRRGDRAHRVQAHVAETDAQVGAHIAQLLLMTLQLRHHIVHTHQGCTAELKLAGGLQGDGRAAAQQGDGLARLEDRLPVVAFGQALKQGPNANPAFVLESSAAGVEGQTFVLSAQAQFTPGLGASLDPGHALSQRFQGCSRHQASCRGLGRT